MTELETLLEMGEEYARKVLLEHRHRQLIPTYHLIGADNKHSIMHCPWENDLQKQMHFAAVKHMAQEIRCRAFVFVSEGWAVSRLTGEEDGPQPKDDPNRIECVNISAGNATGNTTIVLRMVRDRSPGMRNLLLALEPYEKFNNSGGRMIDGIVQPQEGSH